MKTMIALLLISSPALGYGYTENTYEIGNNRYIRGYNHETGDSYNFNTYKSGNMTFGSGYDSRGNSVHCTSYRIGNSIQTNCD